MHRRHVLLSLALSIGASLGANAQTWPQRPIKLIVPYAPGGSADIAARLVTDEWAKKLGGVMVVDNRAGAGGTLGVDAVAKAAPDGYTIGLQTVSLAINPALTPKMPYDTLKDLAPIGMVASSQHVLVVTNNLPATDVKSLIALLKAEPGKHNYASAGGGSTFHMAAELFKANADVPLVHIPYRGGGPALVDTIGGQVSLSFPVLSAALPQVQGGKLRALGVTGTKRSPLMPNVPTLAEAGLPNYRFETWFMVFAPAATPKAIIDKLNASLNEALSSPAAAARMTNEGFDPIPSTPEQASARLEKELPQWGKLIKERGIKAD
ncbi:tripartite tricarboxylate transporter substrate binding protein [Variovorax sp. RT4R15]|uniref:tripartite tricarboxylate transporter substrate binding protein n=1 Tax=Variovorax sp. RT4R15 TaxID=3443737 RepID=UPI003F48D3F9